jgi:hypothetical protein
MLAAKNGLSAKVAHRGRKAQSGHVVMTARARAAIAREVDLLLAVSSSPAETSNRAETSSALRDATTPGDAQRVTANVLAASSSPAENSNHVVSSTHVASSNPAETSSGLRDAMTEVDARHAMASALAASSSPVETSSLAESSNHVANARCGVAVLPEREMEQRTIAASGLHLDRVLVGTGRSSLESALIVRHEKVNALAGMQELVARARKVIVRVVLLPAERRAVHPGEKGIARAGLAQAPIVPRERVRKDHAVKAEARAALRARGHKASADSSVEMAHHHPEVVPTRVVRTGREVQRKAVRSLAAAKADGRSVRASQSLSPRAVQMRSSGEFPKLRI